MTVWLLRYDDCEEHRVDGVFATRAAAMEHAEKEDAATYGPCASRWVAERGGWCWWEPTGHERTYTVREHEVRS